MSDQSLRFEELKQARQTSIVREFMEFIMENKKWWMAPIVIVLCLVSTLVILAASGLSPFFYTIF